MEKDQKLSEIQDKIDIWIQEHGGYWSPLAMFTSVIEECGELAREINSIEGFKPKKTE